MISLTDFQIKAQARVTRVDDIWKKPTYQITTGSDTEYVQKPNHPNQMITTQIALSKQKEDCLVLEHPTLRVGRLDSWEGTTILSSILGWWEVGEVEVDGYLLWEDLMFFAPSDLLAGLFSDKNLCRTIQRYCKQDARIRVETDDRKYKNILKLPIYLETPHGILQILLKPLDLGKLSVGGLAQNVAAFGGKMLDKDKMKPYITNMIEPYTSNDPEVFRDYLDYAIDDACQLFFLRDANQGRTKMLFGEHGLEVPEREIVTTGSLIASLFQTYMEKIIGEYKAYELFEKTDLKGKTKKFDLEEMLDKATVGYFAKKSTSKKAVLALVQGGRAKNELPSVIKQTGVIADIDLSGAYVTIQKALIYPVGLPVTEGVHESSKSRQTLGQYLKKNEEVLVPRLWAVTVSGSLKHRQTLVPSKVIDTVAISEKYDEDNPKIPADFRLYTKQIINGVITSDVLETLKNVCSKEEYSQWMGLQVVAAAWYPSNLRCDSPKDWYEKTLEHKEKLGNSIEEKVLKDGRAITVDNRSRYWLSIPLDGFLAPYAAKRKELKNCMNLCKKGTEEYIALDAQQNAMKLVGNTNYGVLSSPYFPVGNIVIANNITAAARVAVWLTQVALGCVQSITDGGAYDLNAVRTWKGQKPTMNTISLFRDLDLLDRQPKRGLGTKSLGTVNTWRVVGSENKGDLFTTLSDGETEITAKESGWGYFDKAAIDHVKDYFGEGLSILDVISYEHKDMYVEALYQSQTNYRFTHATGVIKVKARGHKVNGNPYENEEPSNIHQLFDSLASDPSQVPPFHPQTISQVLKCNQANEMLESKTDNVYKQNDLLAGDSIIKRSWLRPLSLSMFHWETDDQYRSWERSVNSLKDKTGWGLEQYFLNDNGTLDYQKSIKDIQSAIDKGQEWLYPVGGKGNIKEKIQAYHPYFNDGLVVEEND